MTMFPSFAKNAPAVIFSLFLLSGVVGCAMDHSAPKGSTEIFSAGDISVTGSWANAGKENGNSAAYMTILNNGATADTLLSVTSTAAQFTELHQSLEEDGISLMRKVRKLTVEPNQPVSLEPGSYHIMLIKLDADLIKGEDLPLTLTFEQAGDVQITAPIMKAGGGHAHH